MLFGDAAASPPEVNYALMAGGDGAATVTAAAAGHQGLADVLQAELAAMLANAGTTAATGWQGLGGTAMLGSASEQAAVLQMASLWMQEAFLAATEAATAHATALSSMVPAPVCTANLETQAALAATNFMGVNTPAILALQALYDEYWTQNASLMTSYQGVVGQSIGLLATPPPFGPPAANPADPGALAGPAQAGSQGALQAGMKSMTQLADSPASAMGGSPMEMMSSMMGQVSSMGGQLSGMAGQAPQLLTSAPSQLSGLFGQFSSMFGQMGGADGAGLLPGSLAGVGAGPQLAGGLGGVGGGGIGAGGLGGLGAGLGGGAGGLGGGVGGLGGGAFGAGAAPAASLIRPASSFAAPAAPGLPAGWAGTATPGGAAPSAGMGGGLFGAPAAAAAGGREQQSSERAPARALQVTASAARRGEGSTN
jgi:PPE-repeat protein